MTYEVRISRQAESYVRRLPRQAQDRIFHRLDQIAADPYGSHTKPLHGLPGRWAARVGPWRIVFTVDEGSQRVNVSDVAPRGDVYRHL